MRFFSAYILPRLAVVTATVLVLGFSATANAAVINIPVQNGSFQTLGLAGYSGQLYAPGATVSQNTQTVTGWTSGVSGNVPGYNFVFSSDAVSASGKYGPSVGAQYGGLYLWSQNPNGTPNGIGPSPDGGNFLAMDGAFESSAISQVVSGLTVGMDTKVYFYYAGAQQAGFDGATTEAFQVTLSDANSTQIDKTGVLDNFSHGFTGWHYTEVDFVPTSTTETLSFLAAGTPRRLTSVFAAGRHQHRAGNAGTEHPRPIRHGHSGDRSTASPPPRQHTIASVSQVGTWKRRGQAAALSFATQASAPPSYLRHLAGSHAAHKRIARLSSRRKGCQRRVNAPVHSFKNADRHDNARAVC